MRLKIFVLVPFWLHLAKSDQTTSTPTSTSLPTPTESSQTYSPTSVSSSSSTSVPTTTEVNKLDEFLTTNSPLDLPQIDLKDRDLSCDLSVAIDETLFAQLGNNMTRAVTLIKEHVDFVNKLFASQVFTSATYHESLYFRLARVHVAFGLCAESEFKAKDSNCSSNKDEYLKAFDRVNYKDFCLAYLFTYVDFNEGLAGLANLDSVCKGQHNSGFVTTLNHGALRNIEVSGLTFAHELSHSFGSSHDSEGSSEDCPQQGFIMNSLYEDKPEQQQNKFKFSQCSIKAMQSTLSQIYSGSRTNCFTSNSYDPEEKVVTSLCGNRVVEPGEECDCGPDQENCDDACCYPAKIDSSVWSQNVTALPCSYNQSTLCAARPSLVFGVYLPFGFMLVSMCIWVFYLRRDWKGERKLFKHITEGNIKIVK